MKCPICHKLLKENTKDNNKYCQGHSILENKTKAKSGRRKENIRLKIV